MMLSLDLTIITAHHALSHIHAATSSAILGTWKAGTVPRFKCSRLAQALTMSAMPPMRHSA